MIVLLANLSSASVRLSQFFLCCFFKYLNALYIFSKDGFNFDEQLCTELIKKKYIWLSKINFHEKYVLFNE